MTCWRHMQQMHAHIDSMPSLPACAVQNGIVHLLTTCRQAGSQPGTAPAQRQQTAGRGDHTMHTEVPTSLYPRRRRCQFLTPAVRSGFSFWISAVAAPFTAAASPAMPAGDGLAYLHVVRYGQLILQVRPGSGRLQSGKAWSSSKLDFAPGASHHLECTSQIPVLCWRDAAWCATCYQQCTSLKP